jgi:hypothetical protein
VIVAIPFSMDKSIEDIAQFFSLIQQQVKLIFYLQQYEKMVDHTLF